MFVKFSSKSHNIYLWGNKNKRIKDCILVLYKMSDRRHIDSPFPHQWVQPLRNRKSDSKLENIPEEQEKHVYINSSNGYLDKRTTRLSVEVSKLQREVYTLRKIVRVLAEKLEMSDEDIREYL